MKYALWLLLCVIAVPLAAQDSTVRTDSTERFSFRFNIQPRFAFRFAFDPDSLRAQRERLKLTRWQEEEINKATRQAMVEFGRLRDLLEVRQADLDRMLAVSQVDEAAAMAALEAVLRVENAIKRLRFTLLIRSKNTLTGMQQRMQWQFVRSEP